MSGKSDKLLIVCFSFPPFPGIGGRRWAKFAKCLAQSGYEVHTLSAASESDIGSEWTEDIKQPNIKSHFIKLGLSKVLSFSPVTFIEKVIYKILWKTSPLLIKGNSQDKVFFIKDKLLSAAENIIKTNSIETVIVTIPPYKLAYYLLPLKLKFPKLKLIVDYRDPWTDNKSYHGFHDITKGRLNEEIKYELEVLNTYDAVLDVNDESLELLKQKITSKNKFHHLPNGFDAGDYQLLEKPFTKKDDKIRFVYSGSFYPNLIYLLNPLLKCIKNIKEKNPELYSKLEFNFFGNMDHYAKAGIEKSGLSIIKFHGSVGKNKIAELIAESDYCMLFSALDHGSAFNTKFYEYLYLRKPIVYLGPKGKLSQFISENNIGVVLSPELLESEGEKELINLITAGKQFNTEMDISNFEVKNICKKLIQIINA